MTSPSTDTEPGSIARLTLNDLIPGNNPGVSLHEIGLAETFAMAECLGAAPRKVVILGIQPREIRPSDVLSEEIAAVIPQIVKLVMDEIDTGYDLPSLLVK